MKKHHKLSNKADKAITIFPFIALSGVSSDNLV